MDLPNIIEERKKTRFKIILNKVTQLNGYQTFSLIIIR